jgi:hypothetical protein
MSADKATSDAGGKNAKRARRTPLFPASSFEEALTVPLAIQKHAAGMKVRRVTLFGNMGKSPDSGASRQLCINAHKYGLTTGSYSAEFLDLTPDGRIATSNDSPPPEKFKARFKLAIEQVPVFKLLYEAMKGNRLPALTVLEDLARENGVPDEDVKECVEVFIVNAKFVGVLKIIAGAERIVPLEQALEELPATVTDTQDATISSAVPPVPPQMTEVIGKPAVYAQSLVDAHWENICFYISPIGEENSEHRKHSDLFLGSVVEPALEEFNLKVVRADKIGKPGMITKQIIEYIVRSRLVIADLSFHNPNVFYELSLRHACRLPTVQLIRKSDKIPFDLDNFRTIGIDTTDIYTLVPNLQSYRAEIATQVRTALKDPDSVDNPLVIYYPSLKVSF